MVMTTSSAIEISGKMAQKAKTKTTVVSIHPKDSAQDDRGTCTSVFTAILVTKAGVSIDAHQLMNR